MNTIRRVESSRRILINLSQAFSHDLWAKTPLEIGGTSVRVFSSLLYHSERAIQLRNIVVPLSTQDQPATQVGSVTQNSEPEGDKAISGKRSVLEFTFSHVPFLPFHSPPKAWAKLQPPSAISKRILAGNKHCASGED